MTPCTLVDALSQLTDPRRRHGQIHPLPAVLAWSPGPCGWGGPAWLGYPGSAAGTATPWPSRSASAGARPRPLPAKPAAPARTATSSEKGHGRTEKRTVRTTSVLTLAGPWKGMKQGFEITRERTVQGQTTVEVEYGIASLPADRADAHAIRHYLRDPWNIENGLHYVGDVTLKEDACRVRSESAPQVLACLRNATLPLLKKVGTDYVPEALELLQIDTERAEELIGIPRCE